MALSRFSGQLRKKLPTAVDWRINENTHSCHVSIGVQLRNILDLVKQLALTLHGGKGDQSAWASSWASSLLCFDFRCRRLVLA